MTELCRFGCAVPNEESRRAYSALHERFHQGQRRADFGGRLLHHVKGVMLILDQSATLWIDGSIDLTAKLNAKM